MRRAIVIALLMIAAPAVAQQPGTGTGTGPAAGSGPSVDVDPLVIAQPEVTAFASPSALRLGQQTTLVVTATYGAGVQVNLPDPLVLGDAFEAGHRETIDRVRTDGRRVREWQIRVYVWELGDLQIPPMQVTFTAGGRAAVVSTREIPLRVDATLADADDPKLMHGLAAPVSLWRRAWAIVFYIVAGLMFAIAALLLLRRVRRKRRARARKLVPPRIVEAPIAATRAQIDGDEDVDADDEPHRETPPPPPVFVPPPPVITTRPRRKLDRIAEEALARLRAIETSGRLDTDRRAAYREMVEVIRDYLGARFGIDAPELTTRELCQALTFRSADAAGLTRAWLAECDLVKYANRTATGDEARGILDGACWLVDRTSPGHVAEAARG
jgi:hypothetical protein